eukprot:COSAG01_NODE_771_length_13718_cov_54.441442_13_plen_140_part_00
MCVADRAVDGNVTADWSRWLSTRASSHHWLIVDLESVYTVRRVNIFAGYKGGSATTTSGLCSHQISVWDGDQTVALKLAAASSSWKSLISHSQHTTQVEHFNFAAADTRFVRLRIDQSKCKVDNHARVYEIQIWGQPKH